MPLNLPNPKEVVVNSLAKVEDVTDQLMQPFFNILSQMGLPQPPKPVRPSQILSQILPELPFPGQGGSQGQASVAMVAAPTPAPQPPPSPPAEVVVVQPLTSVTTPAKEVKVPNAILI